MCIIYIIQPLQLRLPIITTSFGYTGSFKNNVTFDFLIWKGYINCNATKLVRKFGYMYDILIFVFKQKIIGFIFPADHCL